MSTGFRQYVKRYRLQCLLHDTISTSPLPRGYRFVAWQPDLWVNHAEVKVAAFASSMDARIFPNLARLDGCLELMQQIAAHPGFFPEGTWLIQRHRDDVACVQCIRQTPTLALIQNVAVRPSEQGRGLGKLLMGHVLTVLQQFGVRDVRLEVSAKNERAMRLYQHFGFQPMKTLYRETIAPDDEYNI